MKSIMVNKFTIKISTSKVLLFTIMPLLGIVLSHLLVENSIKSLTAKVSALLKASIISSENG